MSNRYSGYPATITPNGDTINLRQMEGYSWSANSQKSYLRPGGNLDRVSAVLHSARPVHSFQTRDLETIFANLSPATITVDEGATWRWQQRNCAGSFKTGTSHISKTSLGGVIKPVSLTCSEEDTNGAIVAIEYHSLSDDGINPPDTKTNSVNFASAPTPTFVSQFFMGPTRHNGAAVLGIDQISINFGLNVSSKLFDNVFPVCATLESRDPSLTLTGTNLALNAAINQFIVGTTGSGFIQYLRRGSNNNARVADASAVHLAASISAGCWSVDEESWQSTGDGKTSVTIVAIGGAIGITMNSTIPAPS